MASSSSEDDHDNGDGDDDSDGDDDGEGDDMINMMLIIMIMITSLFKPNTTLAKSLCLDTFTKLKNNENWNFYVGPWNSLLCLKPRFLLMSSVMELVGLWETPWKLCS